MEKMARMWLDDPIEGFFGQVPLTTIALKDFDDHDIVNSFAVVPDANWYMLRQGFYSIMISILLFQYSYLSLLSSIFVSVSLSKYPKNIGKSKSKSV